MRGLLYLASFLTALHTSLIIYIGSNFLSQFNGPGGIGLIYSLSALGSIIALSWLPYGLRRFSLMPLTLVSVLVVIFLAALLSVSGFAFLAITAFMIYQVAITILRFNLDLHLEYRSDNEHTGGIRGLFLTAENTAWVIAPLAAGFLVDGNNYDRVYTAAALILTPILFGLRLLPEPQPAKPGTRQPKMWRLFAQIWRGSDVQSQNLSRILQIDFLLNLFYAIMVIYMPLHLRQVVGLPWPTIGAVFTIMLLPFLFLTWPLGILADKKWGEKEILTAGLIIAGLSTILIYFVQSADWLIWAGLLFLTRIGAAAIQIAKESYLFKKIDYHDTAILSFSRNLYPLAYLIAPLVAGLVLKFMPINFLFLSLGLAMFLGLPASLKLRDTR